MADRDSTTATTPPSPVSLLDAVLVAAREVARCVGIHNLGSIQDECCDLADAIDAYDRHIEAMAKALASGSSTEVRP